MSHEINLSQVLDYRGSHKAPYYATTQAAGLDLTADVDAPFELPPSIVTPVPTGLWVNLPDGVELQIRPRSGLGLTHSIGIINSPGTIDPDFKDEVLVLLINHGKQAVTITPGQRIAQGVLAPFYRAPQGMTADTKERAGGIGSTGA